MTAAITLSSILPPSRQDELAELLFFNVQQHRVRDEIVNAIEQYGMPEIVVTGKSLRVHVGDLGEVQSVFALTGDDTGAGKLVGVMLYARVSEEKLVLLHIGIDPRFGSAGQGAESLLALRLISRLRTTAKAIRGITQLEILYGQSRVVKVSPGG